MTKDAKTKPTVVRVEDFLAGVTPDTRRQDALTLCAMMGRLSGEPPVMWGPTILGFGRHHYRYDSGREGDTPRVGFSPRKPALVLYVGATRHPELLARLGKHSTGKSCLYVKRLADVDLGVVEALIVECLASEEVGC